jgi:hypothetical protein
LILGWCGWLAAFLAGADGEAEYLVETSVKVSSTGGGVIRAAAPIPREWPEQRIEAGPPECLRGKAKVELSQPGAAVLAINTASLRPNESSTILYRQRVFVKPQPKSERERFVNLPVVNGKSKVFLLPTPTIDSNDAEIKAKAAEICSGVESAREKARKISDWTFRHLEYRLMTYTSAKQAFDTKIGDCEERSSLFIAMCRSQGIPARSVISPGKTRKDNGHAWSEIMLVDAEGNAEWIPVDVGLRYFGELPIAPMVLQKGDSYPKFGSSSARQRLIGSWARGGNGSLTMEIEQDVTPISANAIIDPTQAPTASK